MAAATERTDTFLTNKSCFKS